MTAWLRLPAFLARLLTANLGGPLTSPFSPEDAFPPAPVEAPVPKGSLSEMGDDALAHYQSECTRLLSENARLVEQRDALVAELRKAEKARDWYANALGMA